MTETINKLIRLIFGSLLILTGGSVNKPDLGVNNDTLKPCPDTPNCVNSQAQDKKHYIKPIVFTGTIAQAKEHLLDILKSEKHSKILIIQEHYIRAEFISRLFRFVDDVEFYFPETRAGKTLIHIRSASRIGYSDLGVNRKRIEHIRSKF